MKTELYVSIAFRFLCAHCGKKKTVLLNGSVVCDLQKTNIPSLSCVVFPNIMLLKSEVVLRMSVVGYSTKYIYMYILLGFWQTYSWKLQSTYLISEKHLSLEWSQTGMSRTVQKVTFNKAWKITVPFWDEFKPQRYEQRRVKFLQLSFHFLIDNFFQIFQRRRLFWERLVKHEIQCLRYV